MTEFIKIESEIWTDEEIKGPFAKAIDLSPYGSL